MRLDLFYSNEFNRGELQSYYGDIKVECPRAWDSWEHWASEFIRDLVDGHTRYVRYDQPVVQPPASLWGYLVCFFERYGVCIRVAPNGHKSEFSINHGEVLGEQDRLSHTIMDAAAAGFKYLEDQLEKNDG